MNSKRRAERSRILRGVNRPTKPKARRRFAVETLEGRRLLDASEVGGPVFDFDAETGLLTVTATENDDAVTASVVNLTPGPTDPADVRTLKVEVETGGTTFSWTGPYAEVLRIRFDLDAGDDRLNVSDAVRQSIAVDAGAGSDRITAGGGAARINGGDGDDNIAGSPEADTIDAGRGDDHVSGNEGNDFIQGGWGNDFLAGGIGNDRIIGDPSDWDRIESIPTPDPDEEPIEVPGEFLPGDAAVAIHYRGNDVIRGDEGNDRLHGMLGDDDIDGGEDFDGIHGGTGDDSISGGDEPYIVYVRPGPVGDKIDGGRGNDRIDAGNGDDAVSGGEGNDRIQGGWGADLLSGDGGNDVVIGDPGDFSIDSIPTPKNFDYGIDATTNAIVVKPDDEIVRSRPHHDHILGGDGTDRLHGMVGDDVIDGGGSGDGIHGGSGNDRITGGDEGPFVIAIYPPVWGGDKIDGGLGDDEIDAGGGDDSVFGGDGNDAIQGGWDNDELHGGNGSDEIIGDPRDLDPTLLPAAYAIHADVIAGLPLEPNAVALLRGNDSIFGDAGDDRIHGMFGADEIAGGRGHDGIDGGSGNDRIVGDTGNDKLLGGSGNDIIDGGYGNDWIGGGDGSDVIQGGWNDDEIHGGEGNDSIVGDPGDIDEIDATPDPDSNRDDPTEGEVIRDPDRILHLRGSDLIYGDGGNDRINGMFGNDRIRGGEGNDGIAGGSGSDRITGGEGTDRIHGNRGRDRLLGGADDDRVVGGGASDYIAGDEGADGLHAFDGVIDAICRDNGDAVNADPEDVYLCLSGPVMESVRVRSTAWSNDFENRPAQYKIATPVGGEIDIDGDGTTTIPWANIDQVIIAFDQAVTLDANGLVVQGGDGRYEVASFNYDVESFTGTWTLAKAIDGDRVAIAVVDRNGKRIGNGLDVPPETLAAADSSTSFHFTVAAGDVNGDGVVDVRDVRQAAAIGMFSRLDDEHYIAEHDFDGDGAITMLDALGIRNVQGRQLASQVPIIRLAAPSANAMFAAPEAAATDRVLQAVSIARADRRQDARKSSSDGSSRFNRASVDAALEQGASGETSALSKLRVGRAARAIAE